MARDAAHVLTGSSDGTAILWNAETGRQLRKYTGGPLPNSILTIADMQLEAEMPASFPLAATETPAVSSLEFSPDGQRVLGAGQDLSAVPFESPADSRRIHRFRGPAAEKHLG